MHFVDAWTSLPPYESLVLLLPPLLVLVTAVLPGRAVARAASLAIGLLVLVVPELGPAALRLAWAAVWGAVALLSASGGEAERRDEPRPGTLESGVVGLLLAGVLFAILVVALGREDLPAQATRRGSLGLLLMAAGLAHLMLRRDALRATTSFAALGLGLQWIERAARDAALEGSGAPQGAVPLATAIVVMLAARAAAVRQRDAGSAWVSHAHDLHD